MTLFDVLTLGGFGFGIGLGATFGHRLFGVGGAWLGGIAEYLLPSAFGRAITRERSYVVELLSSDSPDRRRFGLAALHVAFPESATRIKDYRPSEPAETCREKLKAITAAERGPYTA